MSQACQPPVAVPVVVLSSAVTPIALAAYVPLSLPSSCIGLLSARLRTRLGATVPQPPVHGMVHMPAVPPRPCLRLRAVSWCQSAALDVWASIPQQSPDIDVVAIVPSRLLDLWLSWLDSELRLGEVSRSALPNGRALGSFYILAAVGPVRSGRLCTVLRLARSSVSSATTASPPKGPVDQQRDAPLLPRATGRSTGSRAMRQPAVGERGRWALARQGGVSFLDTGGPPVRMPMPSLRGHTAGMTTPLLPWASRAGWSRLPAWPPIGTSTY